MSMKLLLLYISLLYTNFISGQTVIPLIKEGALYKISCKINGEELLLFFDTGASTITLSLNEAQNLIKSGKLKPSDIIGKTKLSIADGKIVDGTIVLLRSIIVGGITINDVEAIVMNAQKAPLLFGQSAIEKLGIFTFNPEQATLTILNSNQKENLPINNSEFDRDKALHSKEVLEAGIKLWKSYAETKRRIMSLITITNLKCEEEIEQGWVTASLSFDLNNNSDIDFITANQLWTHLQVRVDFFTKDNKTYTRSYRLQNIGAHQLVFGFQNVQFRNTTRLKGFKLRIIDE